MKIFAKHYKTNKVIPDSLLFNMLGAKNYQSGKKTIAPETTTNEQANNQIDMSTISGTGTLGEVDVAGKFDKNKAAILAGGSAKKRRIII